jgi:GT2 family glycosyltransferase
MITEVSTAPTLCIAVVLYRSDLERFTAALSCLADALKSAAGNISACRIVIADNDSGDRYRAALGRCLQALAPRFATAPELLLNERNLGYGAAMNRAFAGDGSELFLVLNPDIEMRPPALREAILTLVGDPGIVAVAPRCENGAGDPEYLCKRYPAVLDLLLRGLSVGPLNRLFAARLGRYEYRDRENEETDVVLMSGACMLIRGEVFRCIGGFSDAFFMYFEDFDLSRRAAAHGALRYQPRMQVTHHGGQAARKGWRHIAWFVASARRFFSRHGWRWL